jgi:hypothetical protein
LLSENKQFLMAGMSPPLRQAKRLKKLLLLGCVVAWSLPMKTFSENLVQTNDTNRLKPHQAASTNPPPASPEIFNPDPNKLNLPDAARGRQHEFCTVRVVQSRSRCESAPGNEPTRRVVQRTGHAAIVHAAADSGGTDVAARESAAG